MIHIIVRIVLENRRKTTAHCKGFRSALLLPIRIRKRHIEILVHISVANV